MCSLFITGLLSLMLLGSKVLEDGFLMLGFELLSCKGFAGGRWGFFR